MAYDRGALVERYVNDRRGLEQLFEIGNTPPGERGRVHLDLALSGTLSPVIAENGQAIDFQTPDGVKVLHYASLVVVDARGAVLASWMEGVAEPGLSGIRIVYDDAGAVYPVTVDPLTTSFAWTAEGNQGSAWFGHSVATAGDVNGDGYSEVVVGAPAYDSGDSDEGRVFLYLGTPSGLETSFSWSAESDQANALLGWSVAAAGDVNGDGYADVVVGAFQATNGGYADLYLGSAFGLGPSPDWTADSGQGGAAFGRSVGTAGDGDGYADVIVGAYAYSNDQGTEGRAYVYHGSASGLQTSPSWTAEGNQASALFGGSVATAGDVNGDGYADVIVGADSYDNGQTNEGRALVYHGSAAGLSTVAAWAVENNQTFSQFAFSVAPAGDVNGDGYADVVVGAHGYDSGQTDEGRAYVYHGSATGLSTVAARTLESNQAGARFGWAVAPAGDVNGDGYADVLVGAPAYDGQGRAYVYSGSASGLVPFPAWTANSNQSTAGLQGIAVATAGDVNGDGYADVVVGYSQYDNPTPNEGAAFAYLGSAVGPAGGAAWTADGDQGSAYFGMSVGTAGDVDGDGYSDVIVGADSYNNGQEGEGAALVYRGSATGLVTTPAWRVESDRADSYFGSEVATAGDVNGDGYSDVIVGAYNDANGQSAEGRAYVYHGSATGLATTPAWTAESNQAAALFGTAVGTAGDVDGDGYSDVIVGAGSYSNDQFLDGRVYVYRGSAAGLLADPAWMVDGDQAQSVSATRPRPPVT